ncbi:MAG: endolytic transglycosylase MltG, partial [Cyclobacteriaceae bacterium]|nr:endolytic transglycosylase MltG [Cyclobacteriaceae bacterium]
IIPRDADFKEVQRLLYEEGYVNDLVSFSFLAKLMNYDKNIKPGRYILEGDMTNIQAIRLLRSGNRTPVNITFHNARLLKDLGPKITANLMMTEEEFNAGLLWFIDNNDYGFTADNLISMFIPNTYEVYYNITAEALLTRLAEEYTNFWNEQRQAKATELGMNKVEISTLASIVQEENARNDEKPVIAGLYINRLEKGIALQADPTLKFALKDFSLKRILNVHKEVDSPYNTYKYPGLPPGPINVPEISSIDAVLNYEKHEYIYMCAKEDFSGYHNFAVNYEDHMVNARKYQRALTIEQNKAKNKANE